MRRFAIALAALFLLPGIAPAEETAAAKQYQQLLSEFEESGGTRRFAKRFLELAKQHPQDPAAARALLWVVEKVRGNSDTTEALNLLAAHHLESKELGAACQAVASSRSIAAERVLRGVIEEGVDRSARAQATYFLAALLELEANLVQQLQAQPELAPRVSQYYGQDYGDRLTSLKAADLRAQQEQLYERILKSFSDVELDDTRLGEVAEKMLFRLRHLVVGKPAPEIEGQDIHGQELKLSDFRGNVVMLTFWGHW